MKYKENKSKLNKTWIRIDKLKNNLDKLQKQNIQPDVINFVKNIHRLEYPRDLSDTEKENLNFQEGSPSKVKDNEWYIWEEDTPEPFTIKLYNFPENLLSSIKIDIITRVDKGFTDTYVTWANSFRLWGEIDIEQVIRKIGDNNYELKISFSAEDGVNTVPGYLYYKILVTIPNPKLAYEI